MSVVSYKCNESGSTVTLDLKRGLFKSMIKETKVDEEPEFSTECGVKSRENRKIKEKEDSWAIYYVTLQIFSKFIKIHDVYLYQVSLLLSSFFNGKLVKGIM